MLIQAKGSVEFYDSRLGKDHCWKKGFSYSGKMLEKAKKDFTNFWEKRNSFFLVKSLSTFRAISPSKISLYSLTGM